MTENDDKPDPLEEARKEREADPELPPAPKRKSPWPVPPPDDDDPIL